MLSSISNSGYDYQALKINETVVDDEEGEVQGFILPEPRAERVLPDESPRSEPCCPRCLNSAATWMVMGLSKPSSAFITGGILGAAVMANSLPLAVVGASFLPIHLAALTMHCRPVECEKFLSGLSANFFGGLLIVGALTFLIKKDPPFQ